MPAKIKDKKYRIRRLPLNEETCKVCKMCNPKRSHYCKFTGNKIIEYIEVQ